MARAWAWLNANQGAVSAVVTALGVIVAYLYVRLTRKLAVAANRQADLAQALFETGHRPWLAITCKYNRRADDHENNPSTSTVEVTESQDFIVTVENKGSVPAVILAWEVRVDREAEEPRISRSPGGVEAVVYPAARERLGKAISISDSWRQEMAFRDGEMTWDVEGEGVQAAKKPLRMSAMVRYRGVTDRLYRSRAAYRVGEETRWALVCEEIRLD